MSPATLVLTSVGQILSAFIWLFSFYLTRTKLTNKHGAVCFDTGSYTWYYDCCCPSELINVELSSTLLQNTTSGTNKGLNRQNIPISFMQMTLSYGKFHPTSPRSHQCTVGSRLTGLVCFHMNTK